MICQYCGSQNSANAQACTNCKRIWPSTQAAYEGAKRFPKDAELEELRQFPQTGWPTPDHFYAGPAGNDYTGNSDGPTVAAKTISSADRHASPEKLEALYGYQSTISDRAEGIAGLGRRFGILAIDALITLLIGLLVVGVPVIFWVVNFLGHYYQQIVTPCSTTSEKTAGCLDAIANIFFSGGELGQLLGLLLGFGVVAVILMLVYSVGLARRGATLGKWILRARVAKPEGVVPSAEVWLSKAEAYFLKYKNKIKDNSDSKSKGF